VTTKGGAGEADLDGALPDDLGATGEEPIGDGVDQPALCMGDLTWGGGMGGWATKKPIKMGLCRKRPMDQTIK